MSISFPEIDPIAFHLTETLGIRWYALAYLVGILGGWAYAGWLANLDRDRPPSREDIDNILPLIVLGIILGGRLGYVFFYNFGYYIHHPLHIAFIWEGGMSFHGGLLGAAAACIFYARQQKFSPLAMGDIAAAVTPIGLFFGRIANFINAELYGRIATVPWAVTFPGGGDLPRHPSQLYEALLEGVGLFVLLYFATKSARIRRAPGTLFGLFLIGYALCRFYIEFYREPDVQIGLILDYFTMGQFLTLPMMLAGFLLIRHAHRKHLA